MLREIALSETLFQSGRTNVPSQHSCTGNANSRCIGIISHALNRVVSRSGVKEIHFPFGNQIQVYPVRVKENARNLFKRWFTVDAGLEAQQNRSDVETGFKTLI